MASAGASKPNRIQWKHVFIAVIVIVSTLLLIASIVMITIGYLNPFGTVGLGILGGGCVLYFSALLFLCVGGIWIKNKYYADETDRGKWYQSASEDISLLKSAPNVNAPAKTEAECIIETERPPDNDTVPLCSVSTVFSSISSYESTAPQRTMLFTWQGGDAEKALDCDVFSSSLTVMQHTDMKLQEKLQLKQGLKEQMNCETSSDCKIKDLEKEKIADLSILHSNTKSVSDVPRQRKPVVMDFVETKCSSAEEKQLMNHGISGLRREENNGNKNLQIGGRTNISNMIVEGPQSSGHQPKQHQHMTEQSKHMYEKKTAKDLPKKQRQECKPALEKRKMPTGEKDNQPPGRHWSIISEEDSWIHNPRFQGKTNKGLNAPPTALLETEKKHRSCEKLHTIGQERTEVTLKKLLPNTGVDQSGKVHPSGQKRTSEHLGAKGKFRIKN